MSAFDISFAGAVGAGVLSFLSPCVLPLVPAYLCFLGGTSLDQLTGEQAADTGASRRVIVSALLFVLGFACVFVALGAAATAISGQRLDNKLILGKIARGIINILG
ncbi:MAG: cytochrome c biogenesis protein CcdA, partial [Alphaproteobacteria bacterium]|nr:cytochrome c biogenesis protein CcdA [Alphaproteobacteria bacterium]